MRPQRIIPSIVLLTLMIGGCSSSDSGTSGETPPSERAPASRSASELSISVEDLPQAHDSTAIVSESRVRFADVAETSGLRFVYDTGARGELLMVESIGGGGAWLDYDRDGRLDAYLTQGGIPDATPPVTRPVDQLFRQGADRSFRPIPETSGITDRHYSQGVCAGDFNNDGFLDLYITNVGTNSFLINNGDGTFTESAAELGLDDDRWSSSAAWGDLDLDGDLDLYVCNYLKYDVYDPLICRKDDLPALCHPRQIPHWEDVCFENLGDGTFADRTQDWNLVGPGNKALGVAIADFTNDGWPDIYIANDTTANFLYVNERGTGFRESGLRFGASMSGEGHFQASMGVAVGDYDRSGTLDLYLTHFTGETNTLYKNLGEFGFEDVSTSTGVRDLSFPKLGFGTVMVDFDANGTMELLTANGHIDENNADGDGYRQQPQLFTFTGKRWAEVSAAAGDYFGSSVVGRGVVVGDYDDDGDDDVLVVHQNTPATLLRNDSKRGHWLRVRPIGRTANRDGIGLRVEVLSPNLTQPLIRELSGGTSYASTHESAVSLGLGDLEGPVELKLTWPGGGGQTLTVPKVDRTITVVEPRS